MDSTSTNAAEQIDSRLSRNRVINPLATASGSVPEAISVARFTGFESFARWLPSTKVLGYFRPSTSWTQALNFMNAVTSVRLEP